MGGCCSRRRGRSGAAVAPDPNGSCNGVNPGGGSGDAKTPLGKNNSSKSITAGHLEAIKSEKHRKAESREGGSSFSREYFMATNSAKLDDLYDVGKEIGKGAYGSVATANHRHHSLPRAVKSMLKKKMKNTSQLIREIEIMMMLDHPNIIKLYETFEDAKFIYIIMELCSGGELFDRIVGADAGFSEKIAAKLVKQIISAVYYMHEQGVVHRDLKPENFLLVDRSDVADSTLKVIDFGLSRKCAPGVEMKTMAGTPYYVAPEVGAGKYTMSCDVWSLGVIIYILLCGAPPFYGETDEEVVKRAKTGRFDFDMNEWSVVSDDAKDLISRMLVLNQRNRISAADALAHPWVARMAPNGHSLLSVEAFNNLKSFRAMNTLKKATLTVIAQHLDESAIKDLRAMFTSLDEDNDGTLSVEEIQQGIEQLGLEVPPNLRRIMEDIDSDGSGVIDYTEFLAATLDQTHYMQEDVCWAAFRIFDLDGNGKITKDELASVLSGGAVKSLEEAFGVDREAIEKAVQEVDQDGDGELDFDEFMAMMRSTKNMCGAPLIT